MMDPVARAMAWEANTELIIVPQPNDVLTGRGKTAFQHPGNIILRGEIMQCLEQYKAIDSRGKKSRLIRELVQRVLDRGGRFLKRLPPTSARKSNKGPFVYYLAGYQDARQKISHALRDASYDKVKCMRVSSDKIVTNKKATLKKHVNNIFEQKNAEKGHIVGTTYASLPTLVNHMFQATPVRSSSCDISHVHAVAADQEESDLALTNCVRAYSLESVDIAMKIELENDGSLDSACLDFFNELSAHELGLDLEDGGSSVDDLCDFTL